jgi:hypothetical protein
MLTEDLVRAELQCREASSEVRAAGRRGALGGGRCRGSLGSWAPRLGLRKTCEGTTGVKEVRGSLAVRDQGGRAEYWRRSSGAIPAVAWAGVAGEGLGKLPGTEVELLRGLAWGSCSGAVGPQWSRGCCAAEQGGSGARASMAAVGFRVRAQGSWGSYV